MRPTQHVIISGVVTAGFFALTKSWPGSAACFLSGIFIDIDHFFDYWINKRKLFFSYDQLSNHFAHERQGRLYLFFHSYELLAVYWLAIYALSLNQIWLGIAVGLTTHMIADQIFNPMKTFGYFLWYRVKHGFSKEKIFTKEYYQQLA